jgi:hypothetical protein
MSYLIYIRKIDATVVDKITGFLHVVTFLFVYCSLRVSGGCKKMVGVSVATATSVAYHQRLMAQTNLI